MSSVNCNPEVHSIRLEAESVWKCMLGKDKLMKAMSAQFSGFMDFKISLSPSHLPFSFSSFPSPPTLMSLSPHCHPPFPLKKLSVHSRNHSIQSCRERL